MKTKKAVAKRVKINKNGHVSVGRAYKSHLALSKSQKQKRQLRKSKGMSSSDQKRLKSILNSM